MDKRDAAHLLEQIAAYLELKGENTFRVRAYQNAARAVAHYPGDLLEGLVTGDLAQSRGIGPGTLAIIEEAARTGRARVLEDLRAEIPSGLVEMMRISGLGVTKIRQIHDSLAIDTIADLEAAARDGRLARLPRFGPRTAEKILKGIEYLRRAEEFHLFHHARDEGYRLAAALADLPGINRVELAGSLRRRRELIRDLDLVVETDHPGADLADRLGSVVGVDDFVGKSPEAFTIRFASDTVVDLYLSPPERFGWELLRATGNPAHLEQLRARAKALGLTWDADGLRRDGALLPCSSENDVYAALDLDYVPPELREGTDEVAAAADRRLPHLIEAGDIRGFLHCHTTYSDGTSTIEEWACAAADAGYEYIGITDHSGAATYAGGLYADSIPDQHREIDEANRTTPHLRVLKGVEVDILEDGSLDYDPVTREQFDFVIASVHNRFAQSSGEMTDRILRALDDPTMTILGHPTGRLLLSRDPYPMDLPAILARAADRGVAVEINAHPQRLDLDWRMVRTALELGVTISLGADAHNTQGMSNMDLGLGIARKGGLTAAHVLNCRSLDGFLAFARCRR